MFGFVNPDYTAYVIDGLTAVHWVHASGELFTYTNRTRIPTGQHATDRHEAGLLAQKIAERYLKEATIPNPTTNHSGPNTDTGLRDDALAWAVLDHIEHTPASHDQWNWVSELGDGHGCGTVACFAGWTAILAGGTLLTAERVAIDIPDRPRQRYSYSSGQLDEDHVASVAMTLLGLDDHQARTLFDETNTLADLRYHLVKNFGPRPTAPQTPGEAITQMWQTITDPATKLTILSGLLADLIEDDDLYSRASYGTEPGEKHRLTIEVEQDLIGARTSVDNTAHYIKIGDQQAVKDKRQASSDAEDPA